ncbi:unnamed protein product [Prorocentrum cordatum]|uniref:NACHT domain-containing protein n=1 Tax=Prorocentrum cordatum TaxID=2364126 RepID=A0ABN9THK7_9DINO|nr:unnamed protein product [Polarella glacialis]
MFGFVRDSLWPPPAEAAPGLGPPPGAAGGGAAPFPSAALDAVLAYGVDTAFKYGLDTSFGAVQTMCAVLGLVGGATVMGVARRAWLPNRIPVVHMYNRLRREGGPLLWPHLRLRFGESPYSKLTRDRAVILQGRPQEGKTTLLRTSIPWYRRWNVWPLSNLFLWRGIYFNGAHATGTSFERWLVQQLFGSVPQGGSELHGALTEYRHRQWFRILMEKMRLPFMNPRPVLLIVDQFEQLMVAHPSQALPWADMLTQHHVRDNLARVIFVVSSDAGVQSLKWYTYFGQRYNTVVMDPHSSQDLWKLSMIDRELLSRCQTTSDSTSSSSGRSRRGGSRPIAVTSWPSSSS